MNNYFEIIKPWIGSILLSPIVIFLIINQGEFILLLDHLNLLFHEGGHGVFRPFGKFIYTLGGSLMQVIIPSLFIFYFLWNKIRIGVQIALIYLAQNIMNVSVYIGDAVARQLPLLGGNNVYHDWNYLLAEMNLLSYDKEVAQIVYIFASIICLFALLIPILWRDYKKANINLKL
jgi:hypothetical protein